MTYTPVRTLAHLDTLDKEEMVEGYLDGFKGEPEPKGNRSEAYWHGWRNGATDKGFRQPDEAQRELARVIVQRRTAP